MVKVICDICKTKEASAEYKAKRKIKLPISKYNNDPWRFGWNEISICSDCHYKLFGYSTDYSSKEELERFKKILNNGVVSAER